MLKKTKETLQTTLIVLACLISLTIILYFTIILLLNSSNNAIIPPSQVAEIIDGDTFRLTNGDIIRLLCVDTPEKGEDGYDEATSYLGGRLLYETNLRLEGNETDRYNRNLRWVYVDDVLINKEIIDEGYGELFEYGGEDCGRVK